MYANDTYKDKPITKRLFLEIIGIVLRFYDLGLSPITAITTGILKGLQSGIPVTKP